MSQSQAWSGDRVFDSLGTVIRVRTTDPVFADMVKSLYGHFLPSKQHPDLILTVTDHQGRYHVDKDGERVLEDGSRDKAVVRVIATINEATVRGVTSLVVHAGAVAMGGDVIAFPASAEAGKSTLVAACLQAGFDYVTDEALLIVSAGCEVVPYPKALWLTTESRTALSLDENRLTARLDDRYKSPVLAEELGAKAAQEPLRLRHVVVPTRDAAATSLEPMGGAEMANQLLRHAFNRYDRPHDWFELSAALARRLSAWRLSYGEATQAAERLKSLSAGNVGRM